MRNELGTDQPLASSAKRSGRLLATLHLLPEDGAASVEQIALTFGVSAATIRRDLALLEDQGLIVRTHGGALAQPGRDEVPVQLRRQQARDAKRRIAARAAQLIPVGRYAISMTGGTTTMEIARMLKRRVGLTIVTNAVPIALEVASSPVGKAIITGGYVRAASLEAVGALAEGTYKALNVDTAFMGADGISVDGGVTTHDEVEARTSNAMVHAAQRVIVVADGSKIGRAALSQMATIACVDLLITDASADPTEVERLRRAGIQVDIVEHYADRR